MISSSKMLDSECYSCPHDYLRWFVEDTNPSWNQRFWRYDLFHSILACSSFQCFGSVCIRIEFFFDDKNSEEIGIASSSEKWWILNYFSKGWTNRWKSHYEHEGCNIDWSSLVELLVIAGGRIFHRWPHVLERRSPLISILAVEIKSLLCALSAILELSIHFIYC